MKRKINLSKVIKKLIRNEISRNLEIHTTSKTTAGQSDNILTSNSLTSSGDKLERLIIPLFFTMFKKRLISGGMAVKLAGETGLNLYIHGGIAFFDEENYIEFDSQEVTLASYSDDQWVYVYLTPDGEFISNKYAPIVGDNVNYIPICRVFVEGGATTYDPSLIRDLRDVGIGSESLNHKLRQVIVSLFKAIPGVLNDFITITDATESASINLKIQISTNNDNLLFGSLIPLKDGYVELPKPESGEIKNYIIIARVTLDEYISDDASVIYTYIEYGQDLNNYDIPIGYIEGVTASTSYISSDMIKRVGWSKQQKDFYSYVLSFSDTENYSPKLISSTLQSNQNVVGSIWTQVTFDEIIIDEKGEFNTSTYTYTALNDGKRLVNVTVQWDNMGANKKWILAIYKNDVEIKRKIFLQGNVTCPVSGSINTTLQLSDTDTIKVYVWHEDTVSRNIVYGSNNSYIEITSY